MVPADPGLEPGLPGRPPVAVTRSPRLLAAVGVLSVVAAVPACLGRPGLRPTPAEHPSGSGAVLPVGPLRPDGRWIVDATGRVITIHGLQLARKTAPYHAPPASFSARDAARLRRWGFNAVRLAWFWKGVEPERGRIDRGYVAELDRVGALLARHDVFTLLEAHQDGYNERLGGAGFPDWATIGEVPPNAAGLLGEPSWAAFESLYSDTDGIGTRFGEAWRVMASAFSDNPRMLGYDLVNEPGAGRSSAECLGAPGGCPGFDRGVLQPFQDGLAAAVRTVDRRTITFYEPNIFHDVGAPSRLGPPPATSGPSGFAFHAYCINRFVNPAPDRESHAPGYSICDQADRRTFANAAATAAGMGVPALFGEFGDTEDLVDIRRYLDLADEHLMGWIYWGYKDWDDDPGGQGSGPLFDDSDHDGTLRGEKLALLSRPYAMATAGTPLTTRFDPERRTLAYEYFPDHSVTAPTVIFTAPLTNPRGYRVEVEGARVVSRPHATYLQLRALPGATRVSVRVVGRTGGTPPPSRPGTLRVSSPPPAPAPVVPAAVGAGGTVTRTCAANAGAPDRIDLATVVPGAPHGRRLIGRMTATGGRGSVTTPDAVPVAYGAGDTAWFDLGPSGLSGPAVGLLCRVGGSATFAVGTEPVPPVSFTGRSTHNRNVAAAGSRLAFRVPRPGRYRAEVSVSGGPVRLGLRRPDGSMPGAPVLATPATVDLGVLSPGPASLDVVPGPGAAVTWTVTIRPAG